MDLFETLGLGPRQPEENELYIAIYGDPGSSDLEPAGLLDHSQQPGDAVRAGPELPAAAEAAAAAVAVTAVGAAHEERAVDATGSTAPEAMGFACEQQPKEADRLEALRARCTAWLLPYTSGYVWNKDPLVLRSSSRQLPPWERQRRRGGLGRRHQGDNPASASAAEGPSSGAVAAGEGCLWAVMRFGDAVDDEWWAVWLLLRMTRELQDLSVEVWDNDGQFLLIEAAYALPRWLKPETASHRVWLRCGRLHVIPLPSAAAPDLPASPSVAQALAVLREGRYATASPRVQRPIDERLAGYPGRARSEQQHVARCLLPAPLAVALQSEPQLVAELVEAFYLRDADDMRAASRMRLLPPSLERVPTLVRMTRCHYAQLAQQRFAPPRGWSMPPLDSPLHRAADLGLKLTAAAEIICARVPQAASGGGVGEAAAPGGAGGAATADAVTAAASTAEPVSGGSHLHESQWSSDPVWRRFKGSLEANGYFQDNIPGSRRYKELLAIALESFAAGRAEAVAAEDEGGSENIGRQGRRDPRRRLAALVRAALVQGRKPQEPSGVACGAIAEDDDSWLDQNPDRLQFELERRQAELEEHVSQRSGRNGCSAEGDGQSKENIPPSGPAKEVEADEIASKLRSFMEQLSGMEGVDMPSGLPPGAGAATVNSGNPTEGGVDFDPGRFLQELQKVLGASCRRSRQDRRAGGDLETQDGDGDEEEGETTESADEGSSFFSDDDETVGDEEEESEEEDGEEAVDARETGHEGAVGVQVSIGAETGTNHTQILPAMGHAGAKFRPSVPNAAGPGPRAAAVPPTPTEPSSVQKLQEASKANPAQQVALERGFLSSGRGRGPIPAADDQQQPSRTGASRAASGMGRATDQVAAGSADVDGVVSLSGLDPRDVCGSKTLREGLRWEVSTATDSDDAETADSGADTDNGGEGDAGLDATARLLEALGVEDEVAEREDGDGGARGEKGFSARLGVSTPAAAPAAAAHSASASSAAGGAWGGGKAERGRSSLSGKGLPATSRKQQVAGAAGADDPDVEFLALYDDALAAQLAETTLARSFEAGVGPGDSNVVRRAGAAAVGTASAGGSSVAATAQGLQPVELDMNLVRNLLRSYTAQQGSAGPAGNIAGMLGMSLVAGDVED